MLLSVRRLRRPSLIGGRAHQGNATARSRSVLRVGALPLRQSDPRRFDGLESAH